MVESKNFDCGDVVVHPRRPEWGSGVVSKSVTIEHKGQKAQRLVVDFEHHGRVTINTAVAALLSKGAAALARSSKPAHSRPAPVTVQAPATNGGWLAELERAAPGDSTSLSSLPEALTDPFASLASRLKATLECYRFNTGARSLLDWAVVQTGMEDPLSRHTRQELEQVFAQFARNRQQHLKQLLATIRKQGHTALIDAARREIQIPAAREAIKKALRA